MRVVHAMVDVISTSHAISDLAESDAGDAANLKATILCIELC